MDAVGTGAPARRARGVDLASVGTFLVLAFALAWTCFIGLRALGVPFTVRAAAGMFGPAAAALLTRLVRREGFADIGWWPVRPDLAYLYAYVVPLALLAAFLVLALVTGYQRWHLEENFQLVLRSMLASRPQVAPAVERMSTLLLGAQVVQALTIGVLVTCAFTVGEELGWRGHLLPRLAPLGGLTAAVLVGVVWGLWHAPVIGLDGYEYGVRSWAVVPFFCLFTVPSAIILAWLRFRSGSIWPGVLMHATINSTASLGILALTVPASRFVGTPVGLLGLAPYWAFAIWLAATGRVRAPAQRNENASSVLPAGT